MAAPSARYRHGVEQTSILPSTPSVQSQFRSLPLPVKTPKPVRVEVSLEVQGRESSNCGPRTGMCRAVPFAATAFSTGLNQSSLVATEYGGSTDFTSINGAPTKKARFGEYVSNSAQGNVHNPSDVIALVLDPLEKVNTLLRIVGFPDPELQQAIKGTLGLEGAGDVKNLSQDQWYREVNSPDLEAVVESKAQRNKILLVIEHLLSDAAVTTGMTIEDLQKEKISRASVAMMVAERKALANASTNGEEGNIEEDTGVVDTTRSGGTKRTYGDEATNMAFSDRHASDKISRIEAKIRKLESERKYQLEEQQLAEAKGRRIDGRLEVTTAKLSGLRASNNKLKTEKAEAIRTMEETIRTIRNSITANNDLIETLSAEERDLAKDKGVAQREASNASEERFKIEKKLSSFENKLALGVNYAVGPPSAIRKAHGISCYDDAAAMNGVDLQNIVKDLKEHGYQENKNFQRIAAIKRFNSQLTTGNGSRKKEWWLQYVCDILDVPSS